MEQQAALRKAGHGGVAVKEDNNRTDSGGGDEDYIKEEIIGLNNKAGNGGKGCEENSLRSLSSSDGDLHSAKQDDQLELAKAEMGEVREENQRLRMYMERIMKDYQTLQMQFQGIVQQESKKTTATDITNSGNSKIHHRHHHQDMEEESELVSLSLGRTSSSDPTTKNDDKSKIFTSGRIIEDRQDKDEGLALGLCSSKFEVAAKAEGGGGGAGDSSVNGSPETSLEEVKEDAAETWPPRKVLKTERSGEDEISQQNPVKRARVSVRLRCDTPTMNDGCQWRKYGQKIAKGNPCPRAYYRCTVAPSCPVRKQVQRCADDMSILITTYEGTHNHPLPISATAMASTTSAAASMLMSGSSSSGSNPNNNPSPAAAITTSSSGLHGLSLYLSDTSKTKQFYLPNSSSITSHPTVTLDLTSSNPTSSSSSLISSSSHHFNNRIMPTNFVPMRFSSTNLNFSSLESNPLPISWSNGALSYGSAAAQTYNKNHINSLNFGKFPHQENIYQPYSQKNNLCTPPNSNLPPLTPDTIAAATKVITSDPSFQSVLTAALSSIIGSGGGGIGTGSNNNQTGGGDNKFGQNNLKMDESMFPVISSFPSSTSNNSGNNKCSSSYLNKAAASTTNHQQGGVMFLPPSSPFSASKNKPTSPAGENKDHVV